MTDDTTRLFTTGSVIEGKWVLMETIAKGGMGEVYRAHQLNLKRDVAIKLFDHCLTVSTAVRWFNENSRRCEAALNKLDPRKYPVSEEIRIQPNNDIQKWAVPDLVRQLETEAMKRDRELSTSADAMSQK